VKGYTAQESESSAPALNQLHEECLTRIRYKKTCEIHGEVPNHEIVLGYHTGDDHYVVVDPDELNALRSERDRSITIEKFVPAAAIDPIYFAGTTYYLVPDGKHSAKPYAVFQKAIADEKVFGLATVVITNREKLVAVRPLGHLLVASVLHYAATVRQPERFDVPESTVAVQELKLAKTLIEASTTKGADLDSFHDLYAERLNELVQAKVDGVKLTKPAAKRAAPPVINFAEVLKMSLAEKNKTRRAPAKKKAASHTTKRRRSG
jgi:DNA end-binding protein Ku